MNINVASVSDKKGLDRVYILLNSLKQTKQNDTIVNYYLVIEDADDEVKKYFLDLVNVDFRIQIIDTSWFKQRINPPQNSYLYYVRCLFPAYFKGLDKLLYLDTDMVFLQEGVEQLWNTDLTNYSLAACRDMIVTTYHKYQPELKQTKTKCYFNSGMCLFNLKRIRETGMSDQLEKWMLNWNLKELKIFCATDQTLLNYLFRENEVKQVDYKFNDYSLVTCITVFKAHQDGLKQVYGYDEPANSVKDAVILHFLGDWKPWQNKFNLDKYYPYSEGGRMVWKEIEQGLKKKV